MNKQMLKVIGVVILSYIVLSLIVIFVITPSTQLKTNGQSVDERIQHNLKQAEYYNSVSETINTFAKAKAAFNAVDLLSQEETVDFKPLTETINKTIEKLNQVTEHDTDPIKVYDGDEPNLKSLVESHTKLKEKFIELKQNVESINTQIQTILIDRQNGTTSNTPIQSVNKLYDSFKKGSEIFVSINSLYVNTLNLFQTNLLITGMHQEWEGQINSSKKRIISAIIICCLLSIIMVFLVMKSSQISMKQFQDFFETVSR